MSIWIEAVAAVKLFKVEETKDAQPVAASQGRRPHAAGCASFVSSTLKSLTAATDAIQIDMAFGASIADEVRRADLQAFATATGQGRASQI